MLPESTAWRLGVLVCLACVLAGCGAPGASGGTDTAASATSAIEPSTGAIGEIVAGPGQTTGGRDDTTSQEAATSQGASLARARTATITEVVDGDTMEVVFPDGTTDTIRLLGVDTPEVHVETQPGEFEGIPDSAAGRAWLSRWGDQASAFARDRLLDRRVTIATSKRADRRGSYGRLLVTVRVDGTSFNRALIQNGYARVYDGAFATRAGLGRVEARARESNTGLWGFDADRVSGTDADSANRAGT